MIGLCIYRGREIRKIENHWHIESIIDAEFDLLRDAKRYIRILDEQDGYNPDTENCGIIAP
jgi:hypothetical protein